MFYMISPRNPKLSDIRKSTLSQETSFSESENQPCLTNEYERNLVGLAEDKLFSDKRQPSLSDSRKLHFTQRKESIEEEVKCLLELLVGRWQH